MRVTSPEEMQMACPTFAQGALPGSQPPTRPLSVYPFEPRSTNRRKTESVLPVPARANLFRGAELDHLVEGEHSSAPIAARALEYGAGRIHENRVLALRAFDSRGRAPRPARSFAQDPAIAGRLLRLSALGRLDAFFQGFHASRPLGSRPAYGVERRPLNLVFRAISRFPFGHRMPSVAGPGPRVLCIIRTGVARIAMQAALAERDPHCCVPHGVRLLGTAPAPAIGRQILEGAGP